MVTIGSTLTILVNCDQDEDIQDFDATGISGIEKDDSSDISLKEEDEYINPFGVYLLSNKRISLDISFANEYIRLSETERKSAIAFILKELSIIPAIEININNIQQLLLKLVSVFYNESSLSSLYLFFK